MTETTDKDGPWAKPMRDWTAEDAEAAMSTPRPPIRSYREWLESEIDYLQAIGRTEFGDGKLAAYQNALRELQERG